jgi:hypothetical protein
MIAIVADAPDFVSRLRRWCLIALLATLTPATGRAHNFGESYLYLQIYSDHVTGRFEIALVDLNHGLELYGTDRVVTLDNLDEKIGFLQDYYRKQLEKFKGEMETPAVE